MSRKDHKPRSLDYRVPATNNSIKNAEIPPARKRGTGTQCFIEPAEFAQHVPAEGHIATSAKDPRPARIKRIAWQCPTKAFLIESPAESVPFFKKYLRSRVQFQRHHQTGETARIRISAKS